MSPLSFPKLDKTVDGLWQATCRRCGWQSIPIGTKTAADYARKVHGPEALCTKASDGR